MRREARRKLLLLRQTRPLLFAAAVSVTGLTLMLLMVMLSANSYSSLRFEGNLLRGDGFGSIKKCVTLDFSHFDDKYFDPNACISVTERTQKITALIKTLTRVLNEQDIDYWLDSGTLLGQFRTQSVIPWDTDADIGITMEGYEFLRDNVIKFPASSYELQVLESDVNLGPDRDWNIPVRFVETTRGFYVDVFVFSKSTVNDVEMLTTTPSCSWIKCAYCVHVGDHAKFFAIPKYYIYPLISCKFADFEVLCPARRTLYLEHLYGVDFRVGKPAY